MSNYYIAEKNIFNILKIENIWIHKIHLIHPYTVIYSSAPLCKHQHVFQKNRQNKHLQLLPQPPVCMCSYRLAETSEKIQVIVTWCNMCIHWQNTNPSWPPFFVCFSLFFLFSKIPSPSSSRTTTNASLRGCAPPNNCVAACAAWILVTFNSLSFHRFPCFCFHSTFKIGIHNSYNIFTMTSNTVRSNSWRSCHPPVPKMAPDSLESWSQWRPMQPFQTAFSSIQMIHVCNLIILCTIDLPTLDQK